VSQALDKTFPSDAKLSYIADALQKELNLPGGVESLTSQAVLLRNVWKEAEFRSVALGQAQLVRVRR
jgi:hypothetical protein